MESKTHRNCRLSDVNEVVVPPLKSKARKLFWDSLCEVYEKEADKENQSDCEELQLEQLEAWSVTKRKSDLRALTHLAQINPQLVSSFFSGAEEELNAENKQKKPKKVKNKRCISTSKKKEKVSSPTNVKNKKKEKNIQALPVPVLKPVVHLSEKRKQILTLQKQPKKLVDNLPILQAERKVKKTENVSKLSKTKENSKHKCNLKLRYYSRKTNESTRADGRVFSCKLVFKVCECFESDEVF